MTREEYIKLRDTDQKKIIEYFYKNRFDPKKHKPELTPDNLAHTLMISGTDIGSLINYVIQVLDVEFEITEVIDASGKTVKLL